MRKAAHKARPFMVVLRLVVHYGKQKLTAPPKAPIKGARTPLHSGSGKTTRELKMAFYLLGKKPNRTRAHARTLEIKFGFTRHVSTRLFTVHISPPTYI